MASAATVAAAWLCFLLAFLLDSAESFAAPPSNCKGIRYDHILYSVNSHDGYDGRGYERRSFLTKTASIVGIATVAPTIAIANESSPATATPPLDSNSFAPGNYDGLLDLPPITPGCVRLYLCRHGQTENNRLGLVQGSRVDPSLNGNGNEQARRLGLAVSRLKGRDAVPKVAVHSNLRRARETAEVLTSTATAKDKKSSLKIYGELPSLGEVDFGSLEGKDVKVFRRSMRITYAAWSFGDIDKRISGGESGREVLERVVISLEELSKMAVSSSKTSSILAVSHSAYLKILISLVADNPLAESVLWKIQNTSVNVVDVNVEGKRRVVTSSSGLFGGELVDKLRGSNGIHLDMPEAHLIRRNEARHLEGMDV